MRTSANSFGRQVLTLMSGTGVAQLLPLLAAPLLTRLFGPGEFGVFALFMSATVVLTTICSGRYELAILLPSDDNDGLTVLVLGIVVSLLMNLILLVVALVWRDPIAHAMGDQAIGPWLPLLPAAVLAMTAYQSLNYWFNRQEMYRRLARNRIIRSGVTVLATIAFGMAGMREGGLILGTVLAQFAATGMFFVQGFRENHHRLGVVTVRGLVRVARRYRAFPTYSVPADSINAASAQLPVLVLTSVFGPLYAGYYSLTQRVLGAPMSIIATAFGDVFKQRASRQYSETGECAALWSATFKRLVILAILPFLAVAALSPMLFPVLFGEEWREAGYFARALAPYFGLALIASPLSRMLYVAEKQHVDLMWQIGLALSVGVALYLGSSTGQPRLAVGAFGAAYSLMYVIYLLVSRRLANPNRLRNVHSNPTPGVAR